jgi:molybdenum cofactor cytidylyltransferase
MRIVAVILAAGAGQRMGGPKALLRLGRHSLLALVAERLRRPDIESICAVIGHEAACVRREAEAPADITLLENPDPGAGMLSSVQCGLRHADGQGADAVLIHPVDHPLVDPATIDRVCAALERGAAIAVPSWENRRGHPAGFARAAWSALQEAPADRGARAVLHEHPDWVVHVTGDAGCLDGIDTPADYERVRRAWENGAPDR